MSFLGRRGIISSGVLGGTVPLTTANMNGSDMFYTYGTDITSGLSTFSIGLTIKPDNVTTTVRLFNEEIGANAQCALFLLSSGKLEFGYRTTSTGSFTLLDSASSLSVGVSYNILITLDVTSAIRIYIDGSEDINTAVSTAAITTGARDERDIGRRGNNNSQHYDGTISFIGFWSSELNASAATDFYNLGVAECYGSLPASLTSTLLHYYHSAEFTDHTTDELTDQEGSNNLTNNGSIPMDGTGLTVSC